MTNLNPDKQTLKLKKAKRNKKVNKSQIEKYTTLKIITKSILFRAARHDIGAQDRQGSRHQSGAIGGNPLVKVTVKLAFFRAFALRIEMAGHDPSGQIAGHGQIVAGRQPKA